VKIVSATLKLERQGFGFELRRGNFAIYVDGHEVGSIDWHGSVELPIEPGDHALQLRAGRYSSASHSFSVSDGSMVSFRCHGARIWPTYLASFVKPDLAISLRRE
jgi:hypothetical protein